MRTRIPLGAALLGALLALPARSAPVKAPPAPAPDAAEKLLKDALTAKKATATVGALKDKSLEAALPGVTFVAVRFAQWPVAVAPAAGFKASNVCAVTKVDKAGGAFQTLRDADELTSFALKALAAAKTDAQLKDAAHAFLLLTEQLQQDGYYKFTREADATKVSDRKGGGKQVTAKSVVMAGGNGTVAVTLQFDADGKCVAANAEVNLRRGTRPRCQATKLLDKDPIVRKMAEQDLLVMGKYAKPYLDEQRAEASAELKRAIDAVWKRICDEDR